MLFTTKSAALINGFESTWETLLQSGNNVTFTMCGESVSQFDSLI